MLQLSYLLHKLISVHKQRERCYCEKWCSKMTFLTRELAYLQTKSYLKRQGEGRWHHCANTIRCNLNNQTNCITKLFD